MTAPPETVAGTVENVHSGFPEAASTQTMRPRVSVSLPEETPA